MPLSDEPTGPRFNRTISSTEKKQFVAARILQIARKCIRDTRRDLRRISTIIDKSPGTKAQVLAELTEDESTELEAIFTVMKSLANTHKPTGAPDLDESVFNPKSDREYSKKET